MCVMNIYASIDSVYMSGNLNFCAFVPVCLCESEYMSVHVKESP